ncbi:MAG: diguanylate cyclase, partial [Clostridiales bacterium]|nr:diguanylate cyclase [Clostridiales bacterium]
MSGIPYLYVNILALCLFLIMLFALLAAKKTPEIRSFLAVLLGFSIWSGGSILMRLRMFPGVSFWFYVSIMGLFSCGLLLYMFINSFVGAKGCVMKSIWGSGTLVILVFTALGFFLKPPAVVDDPVMGTLFLYDMDWRIGIPVLFFIILIASMLMLFRRYIKEKGLHSPGVIYVIIGSLAVAIGNVIQIIPGNVFPWDMLSGAVFAVMLMFALYRKHMFHMTLVISRSILMLVCATICVLSAVNFIPAAQEVLTGFFTLSAGTVTAVIAIIFAVIIAVIYVLLKKLFDNLFVREEQQNKLLKNFSNKVTQTLDTGEIMAAVADIISEELRLDRIYVLLPEDGKFVARHCTHPLDTLSFSFAEDSPCINFLRGETPYFVLSEFIKLPLYMSMWETEKELLKKLEVGCVAALKNADEIAGVILLPKKLKDASYTFIELNFLQTVCAIASIALKNAALYERVFSEARVDSLTGVFNYRYFIEKIEAEFDLHGKEALSLIYLDLDDFKLFNQLYGSGTGDDVLRRVAAAIVGLTGDSGTVFRHGGKVFAVILPGYDVRESLVFAEELSRRVSELNTAQNIAKPLSASIGICAAPYSASSAQEMVENADLAVYNAKQAGKGNVQVFHVHKDPSEMNIAERAMQIVDRAGHSEASNYDTYSHTVYALTAAIH